MVPKDSHKDRKKLLADITQLPLALWEREDSQPNKSRKLTCECCQWLSALLPLQVHMASPADPGGAGLADRELCPRGSTSQGLRLPQSRAPRAALAPQSSGTPGASRLQCAHETRDGNNWQSPPARHGRPWEGLQGPAAQGWEQRCPNSQHLRQCLPFSGCPAETRLCSQALTLRTSPAESRGINEEHGVPPPHSRAGGTQRGISTCN